jgi:hypothetical protein
MERAMPMHLVLVQMGDVVNRIRTHRFVFRAHLAHAAAEPVGAGITLHTVEQDVSPTLVNAMRQHLLQAFQQQRVVA